MVFPLRVSGMTLGLEHRAGPGLDFFPGVAADPRPEVKDDELAAFSRLAARRRHAPLSRPGRAFHRFAGPLRGNREFQAAGGKSGAGKRDIGVAGLRMRGGSRRFPGDEHRRYDPQHDPSHAGHFIARPRLVEGVDKFPWLKLAFVPTEISAKLSILKMRSS